MEFIDFACIAVALKRKRRKTTKLKKLKSWQKSSQVSLRMMKVFMEAFFLWLRRLLKIQLKRTKTWITKKFN